MLRPTAMRTLGARCNACGLCFEIAPVILADPERIPVSAAALEAMAACPTGAIVWREPEEPEEANP